MPQPDYENDLVFPPKSADDLNKQERQSDVLIAAVDKCEKLEKEVKQLKEGNNRLNLKITGLQAQNAELIETNDSLSRQNIHLLNLQKAADKEVESLIDLLKECKPYISYKINQNIRVGFTPDDANLLTHINAAISESDE